MKMCFNAPALMTRLSVVTLPVLAVAGLMAACSVTSAAPESTANVTAEALRVLEDVQRLDAELTLEFEPLDFAFQTIFVNDLPGENLNQTQKLATTEKGRSIHYL